MITPWWSNTDVYFVEVEMKREIVLLSVCGVLALMMTGCALQAGRFCSLMIVREFLRLNLRAGRFEFRRQTENDRAGNHDDHADRRDGSVEQSDG